MSEAPVSLVVDGSVARLRLDRPAKRNAVTMAMWATIGQLLHDAGHDEHIRALVVEGTGSVFCAGADLAEVKSADGTQNETYGRAAGFALTAIRDFPHPTLAVIEGACIGAGCAIALACDVRLSSPAATFSIPAARHGIVYDDWSIARLVDLMGTGRTSLLLYAGAIFDAATAYATGLVDAIDVDVRSAADSYLAAVVGGHRASIAATRRAIRTASGLGTWSEREAGRGLVAREAAS